MSTALRLATYNVEHLTYGTANVARVLRSLSADVVCVQDAPRLVRWRSRCAALARRAGLVYVTGGRTGSGTVLLASFRTMVTFREDFPLPRSLTSRAHSMAIAVFRFTSGQQLVVGSMRLGRDADQRLRHVDLMVRRLESLSRKYEAPYVLGGDVAERQDGLAWQHLAALLTDGHTVAPQGGSVTFGRTSRIDGIFASSDVKVVGCGVPRIAAGATASTHQPVLAELQLP